MALCGQFVIEASTSPEQLDELLTEVARLLRAHTETVDPVGLERARNQIAVRAVRARERPVRRLEDAAMDVFVRGRVRSRAELAARVDAVSAAQVRSAFEQMLAERPAVALAGRLGKARPERFAELVGAGH
jgi:predicted Zn-dependent peptidase